MNETLVNELSSLAYKVASDRLDEADEAVEAMEQLLELAKIRLSVAKKERDAAKSALKKVESLQDRLEA